MSSSFQPIWASPPGDTISDLLSEKKITKSEFAKLVALSEDAVDKLLCGSKIITSKIAALLEEVLGSTSAYWITREAQFRNDLARYKEEVYERKAWAKVLPVSDIAKLGWLDESLPKEVACLKFFGVGQTSQWYEKYHDLLAVTSFRTSQSFDSQPESVIAWLRKGELESKKVAAKWDKLSFASSISDSRKLTREPDPEVFIPRLKEVFSRSGVTVVIEKCPTKCKASGAAYFATPEKAIILLSARHLTDDHFWFSFFHETAHLILHGNKKLYIEFENHPTLTDDKELYNEEREADQFAEDILIPNEYKDEFMSLNSSNWKKIVRFSKKVGISPGIVVGQLQHCGIVDVRYLNKLKKRYRWQKNKLVKVS